MAIDVETVETPTSAEPVWPELVTLAARICGAPLAWIRLANGRRWVSPDDLNPSELSLLDAFGAETMKRGCGWSIGDLAAESRFPRNGQPIGLRSIAGVCLHDGPRILGEMGVAAPESAAFDESTVELLSSLAAVATRQWRLETSTAGARESDGDLRDDPASARTAEERYRALFESSPEAAIVTDDRGHIVGVNRRTEQMFGYHRDQLLGKPIGLLVGERDLDERMESGELTGLTLVDGAFRWHGRRLDGGEFPIELRKSSLRDGGRDLTVTSIRDATDHLHMIADLHVARSVEKYLAYHDTLTGIYNRSAFFDRLEQSIAHAKRYDRLLAVLFLDLDGFKQINDKMGHMFGDLLLKAVARRLQSVLRDSDMVGRYGGDEFVIILGEVGDEGGAAHVAERILDAFSKPFYEENCELRITASIGVGVYPNAGTDVKALVRNADLAMYRAKAAGKNCFQLHDASDNDASIRLRH